MENIPILLQHSGEWDDNNNFINFHVDAILIKTYWKFEQLLREIAKQLQKDSKTIVIQYAIAQGYPPITICSDMSVSVYMELKKSSAGMTTLPLYILECVDERCIWRLKASSLRAPNLFKVTDFNSVHSCLTDKRFCSQKQAVSAFVAAVVQDKLVDPKTIYTPTDIQRDIQKAYGQILPLAYAIVDSENDASWEWFFVQLRETYGQREGICIVSDRHDAIWKATSIVYPEVPHCACMFHLWNNIKTNFRKSQKQIKEVYFALARAYTVEEFNRHMAELEAIDSRVKTYLMDIGYDKWSRAHSKANRTMTMTSNIAESVNAANKHARDLPVVNLLDFMTTLIQKWNYTNRKDAVESFMKIGAKYEKILADNTILSQAMTVLPSTEFLHLIIDGQTRNVVRLHERNCSCGRFQLDDIPCPHAMAAIQKFHMDSYKYCSDYYSIDYLLKTYEIPVNPLPDETTWQIPEHVSSQVVLPPKGKIKPGRLKKKRGIGGWEGNTVTCALCG
ncbi:uncharacterized protein [Nicotiana sylvestris]|uniref:uncharacterized protein n=1 Tax=Nicotiana sylvestris TaxID=4096 RepID=UPI00388C3819